MPQASASHARGDIFLMTSREKVLKLASHVLQGDLGYLLMSITHVLTILVLQSTAINALQDFIRSMTVEIHVILLATVTSQRRPVRRCSRVLQDGIVDL